MKKLKFFDEVHDMQRFVRQNPNIIENHVIISEQLYLRNNETSIIDMLSVDLVNKRIAIIELKNEITTDKNLWQPVRYYDLIRRGEDELKKLLINAASKYNFNHEEIDLNAELILIVPECNDQLLRTLSYFEEIDSTVIELKRYVVDDKEVVETSKHKPLSIFHKEDLVTVQNKISKDWSYEAYINSGINREKIKLAKQLAELIERVFSNKGYKFDIFFSESKITITKNNKVCVNLFVKQSVLDYMLTVSFKVLQDVVIIKNDFVYNSHIEKFEMNKSNIKLKVNGLLERSLLEKYI